MPASLQSTEQDLDAVTHAEEACAHAIAWYQESRFEPRQ